MRLKSVSSLRLVFWAVGVAMIFISMASPARADSMCVTSNLAALIGTTCDIGSLQFTFGGITTDYRVFENTVTDNTPLMADDFTVTPLPDGFQLSGPGVVTITAPNPTRSDETFFTDEDFFLYFAVTDLNGAIGDLSFTGPAITGVSFTGGNLTASGTSRALSLNGVDLDPLLPSPGFPASCSSINSQNRLIENLGTISTERISEFPCAPIYFALGDAQVVSLYAQDGDTASVDTTDERFTFTTPEPGTLTLLLCGLMLLVGFGCLGSGRLIGIGKLFSHF